MFSFEFCEISKNSFFYRAPLAAASVGHFIALYGHGYRRLLMPGSIQSMLGILCSAFSQRRVALALQQIATHPYESQARDIYERTNSVLYFPSYSGCKVHMDDDDYRADHSLYDVIIHQNCLLRH